MQVLETQVVEALYRGLLDRDPDAAGTATYIRMLREGEELSEVVRAIRHSPEAGRTLLRSPALVSIAASVWEERWSRNSEVPLYFLHMMKTGGSALVEGLGSVAGQRFCLAGFFLDHLLMAPPLVLAGTSLVAGHMGVEALDLLPSATEMVVALRDPVERVLSHYAHVVADPALDDEARGLTLEEFVGSERWRPFSSNYQARCLVKRLDVRGAWLEWSPVERLAALGVPVPANLPLPLHALYEQAPLPFGAAELLAQARARLESVQLAGTSEHLDCLFRRVAARWGVADPPQLVRLNVSAGRPRAQELSPALLAEIEEANAVDLELYELLRSR